MSKVIFSLIKNYAERHKQVLIKQVFIEQVLIEQFLIEQVLIEQVLIKRSFFLEVSVQFKVFIQISLRCDRHVQTGGPNCSWMAAGGRGGAPLHFMYI